MDEEPKKTIEHQQALSKSIYDRDTPKPESWGRVQWKATVVCIDIHCKCGAHCHFDGDFFYFFDCPHCRQRYAVGQVITLIPLVTEDQRAFAEGPCLQKVDRDERLDEQELH